MASFFDEIFQLSGDAPVNPLFTRNNKYKSAKVALSLASGDGCDQRTADVPAPVKDKKAGKKRKAAELAAQQEATDTGHKVVASTHIIQKHSASDTQSKLDAPAPAQQPQLGKRKRQDIKSIDKVQTSPAVLNNTVDRVKELPDDASAAVHETATQVHTA